jgi:agmatine deiminase
MGETLLLLAVHREWGKSIKKVKRELSKVVKTIARYEKVHLLVPRQAAREALREFSSFSNVIVIKAPVDDIWMRDIAPTFAIRKMSSRQEVVAIDWNFNAWGGLALNTTRTNPTRGGDRDRRRV